MPTGYEMPLSEAQYLMVEEASLERHEYVAGRMFAMSGATLRHNTIVSNLLHHIYDPVRAAGCRVVANDMKLKVELLGAFYYPDLLVVCSKSKESATFVNDALLVVEVLSPSTAQIDQREKLMAYRTVPGIREYAIVNQDQKRVDLFRKDVDENWQSDVYTSTGAIAIRAIGATTIEVTLEQIYTDVDVE